MKFNKLEVAYMLQKEGIGRKYVIEHILHHQVFRVDQKALREFSNLMLSQNIKILSCNDSGYPQLLKEIYDFPLVLFCKGNTKLLNKEIITMVGTREMTRYGKWCVRYMLEGVKEQDIVVVSGLARGVDAQVHQQCLDLGIPTVAVVAGGIDKGYPKSNEGLYQEIVKKGLIISEFPPGRVIAKGMFPVRNRILAGLSLSTVVVESGEQGGSLITARMALEYGREVFCIPCGINRFALQGCNMLLERGSAPLYSPNQLTTFLSDRLRY